MTLDMTVDPSLRDALVADRKLAAEITPAGWTDPLLAAREAAARHNARVDAPIVGKKGGWDARATGVRIDAEQQRHPWSLIGHGETSDEATADLIAKLEGKVVERTAVALCFACGQPLPV